MSVTLEQFRRVNPYPGLMVDVDVWRDAHDYHRAQLHLHHLALHGWGIVMGLDVTLVDGKPNTVRIEPGLAIDPGGNFISVPEGLTYEITSKEKQVVYLVLQLRELLAQPAPAAARADRSVPLTRVVEAYRVQERDRLPEEPYIELARVDFVPGKGALRAAAKADSPGANELDLRSRVRLGTLAAPVLAAPPVRATKAAADGADGLAPRVESLSEQLGSLSQQVESLARDVVARPAAAADAVVSDQHLEGLTAQVRQLAERVDALASSPGSPPNAQPDASTTPAPDQLLEALAAQVRQLAERVDALAGTPASVPSAAPETSTPPPPDQHVQALAGQVRQLAEQLQALAAAREAAPAVVEPMIDPQLVAGVAAEQIAPVAQRVDELARQLDTIEQRGGSEAAGLLSRVDGLRSEVDAFGVQLQALSRQLDTLPAASAPGPSAQQTVLQLAIGEHGAGGWDAHRAGLISLASELGHATQFAGRALEPMPIGEARSVDVLYLSGHGGLALGDAEVDGISQLLDAGGVIIGEGCAAGAGGEAGAREFAMSFVDLATRLGRQLTTIDRGHALMRARHIFGEPPPGGRANARVLESGGMVYSDADYGCAWQGGPADRPLPRGVIRDAFEFGTNLAIFRAATRF
jgi:hypothetical protein